MTFGEKHENDQLVFANLYRRQNKITPIWPFPKLTMDFELCSPIYVNFLQI